jgi:hypothetical protein
MKSAVARGNVQIAYNVLGTGAPMVLLHNFGETRRFLVRHRLRHCPGRRQLPPHHGALMNDSGDVLGATDPDNDQFKAGSASKSAHLAEFPCAAPSLWTKADSVTCGAPYLRRTCPPERRSSYSWSRRKSGRQQQASLQGAIPRGSSGRSTEKSGLSRSPDA